MPGTAKVICSNVTEPFFIRELNRIKKMSASDLSAYVLSA